ncbi:MAG: hypothetical protein H0U45_12940 [Tatlockia sp.]|nr:hypothetical protein [Tatlockia sp.]
MYRCDRLIVKRSLKEPINRSAISQPIKRQASKQNELVSAIASMPLKVQIWVILKISVPLALRLAKSIR